MEREFLDVIMLQVTRPQGRWRVERPRPLFGLPAPAALSVPSDRVLLTAAAARPAALAPVGPQLKAAPSFSKAPSLLAPPLLVALQPFANFFVNPVSLKDAPDYNAVVAKPMCLRNMKDKLRRQVYVDFKHFVRPAQPPPPCPRAPPFAPQPLDRRSPLPLSPRRVAGDGHAPRDGRGELPQVQQGTPHGLCSNTMALITSECG